MIKIKSVKYFNEIRLGSSLPLVVGGDDNTKYVVKLNGSGDGVIANATEWIAIKLGRLLGIPVLEPTILEIAPGSMEKVQDPEIMELIDKSSGLNFGTRYLEGAVVYDENSGLNFSEKLKDNIFLYDLFLLNIDRTAKNPDIICRNHQLLCLDFAASITVRSSIDGKDYHDLVFLPHMKQHPFYRDNVCVNEFISRLKKVRDKNIYDVMESIPGMWLREIVPERKSSELRVLMGDRLIEKRNQADSLTCRIEILEELPTETEAERRSTALKNRNAFKKKIGLC